MIDNLLAILPRRRPVDDDGDNNGDKHNDNDDPARSSSMATHAVGHHHTRGAPYAQSSVHTAERLAVVASLCHLTTMMFIGRISNV